jgi:hypothetical protein
MKTQISRHSFRATKRYSGVYQQQGRMLVDADWNELVDIVKHRLDHALKDVVNSGAPLNGGILDLSTDPPQIRWGTLYADGIKAELMPRSEPGAPLPAAFDFTRQHDFPGVDAIVPSGDYILYADVWERPVISIEDETLRDPGLHGADTCTRTKTMVQIKWCPVDIDPETDVDRNPGKGDAGLDLSLRDTGTGDNNGDPCSNEVTGIDQLTGNFLFRLEIHRVDGPADHPDVMVMKWSTENGAEQHRVRADGDLVDTVPVEFKTGDWIFELTNDTSEAHMGVHLVEPPVNGFPARFDLTADGYPEVIPADAQYIRRWDGYCKLIRGEGWSVEGKDGVVDLTLVSPSTPDDIATHGDVKFESGRVKIFLNSMVLALDLDGKHFVTGDYWQAVVRDNIDKADQVQLISRLPMGIRHHYVTIARFQAGAMVSPGSEALRKMGFPALSDVTAGKVGYDPTAVQTRWQDIHDNPALPMPLTVQAAIDDLVQNLESSDIAYRLPSCDAPLSVRDMLPAIKDLADATRQKINEILDALLCGMSAATLPCDDRSVDIPVQEALDNRVHKDGDTMTGKLTIQSDLAVTQQVGIGTEAPQEKLDVRGGGIRLREDDSGPELSFKAGGVGVDVGWKGADLRISPIQGERNILLNPSNQGDVGIGTATPEAKLDVNGQVRADGFIGNGSALTDLDASQITSGTISSERLDLVIPQPVDPGFGKKVVEFSGYPGGYLIKSLTAANGDVWLFWYVHNYSDRSIWCRRYSNGSWSEEMAVTRGNYRLDFYELLEDRSGNLWLFWRKYTGGGSNMWCSRFDGRRWTRETQLTSGATSKSLKKPFTDREDSIWFCWQDDTEGRNLWFRRHRDGVWSAARAITSDMKHKNDIFAFAVPGGDVWLFWRVYENNVSSIWCARFGDGGWETAIQLSAATSSMSSYPPLADDAGNILVFWQNRGDTGRNFSGRVFDIDRTDWGAKIQLTSGGLGKNHYRSFVDDAGRFWLFWSVYENNVNNMWAKSFANGSWTVETQLTTSAASKGFYACFSDSGGNVWLFWQEYTDPGRNLWARRYTGVGWGLEIQLTTGETPKHYFHSFADSAGGVWFFWQVYENGTQNIWCKRFVVDTWGADTALTSGPGRKNFMRPFAGSGDSVWFFWQRNEADDSRTTMARTYANGDWGAANQLMISGSWCNLQSMHKDASGDVLLLIRSGSSTLYLRNSNDTWAGPEYVITAAGSMQDYHFSFCDTHGNLWLFWTEVEKGARNLWCRKDEDGTLHGRAQLTSGLAHKHFGKALEDNQGSVWCFWQASESHVNNLWCKRFVNDGWSGDMRLTAGTLQKYYFAAMKDRSEGVWFFWQVIENNVSNMWGKRFVNDIWEADTQLTSGAASKNFWQPLVDHQNNAWFFWQDNSTTARNFWFRMYDGTQWGLETQLTSGGTGKYNLRSFVDGAGLVWFFWHVDEGNVWNMWCKRYANGSWSEETRLTSGPANKSFCDTKTDGSGGVWFFWQVFESNTNNMWCRRFFNGRWSEGFQLTSGTAYKGFHRPLVDAAGSVWLFWQNSSDPGRNIWCRQHNGTGWNAETQVTSGEIEKSFIRSFVDSKGYVWLFWFVYENNIRTLWCKRFSGRAWQSGIKLGDNECYPRILNGGGNTWLFRDSETNIWENLMVDGNWITEPQIFGKITSKRYLGSFNNETDDAWVVWEETAERGISVWAKKL